jgi:hypothetical protein
VGTILHSANIQIRKLFTERGAPGLGVADMYIEITMSSAVAGS